eukprot:XP_019074419.1 PREDICTED: diacylglycerol kinase 6-like [Vitis vinifera]
MMVLVNLEDDAILGNELLSSWRGISYNENMVIDVSKLHLHDVFNKVHQYISSWESRGRPIRTIIVWSGDAMANQLMQLIMHVVRNLELHSNPPILLLLPLGSKANISFSLGWENQPLRTLPKDIRQLLEEVISEPKKNIDRKDQGSPKSPRPALGPARARLWAGRVVSLNLGPKGRPGP